MGKVAKIAISLPEDVFKAIERERKARGESRSEFLRRAAQEVLRQDTEKAAAASYIRSYKEMPETHAEVESVHRAGSAILANEPWE